MAARQTARATSESSMPPATGTDSLPFSRLLLQSSTLHYPSTTMTVPSAQILTAETIPAYLADRLNHLKGVIDSVDSIQSVEPILGGNVNYAFCIVLDDGMKVFLKQAPEFVAIFGPDGFPLTSERMQREMDVYSEWQSLLSMGGETAEMLPDIYYFDSKLYLFLSLWILLLLMIMMAWNGMERVACTRTISISHLFLLWPHIVRVKRKKHGSHYGISGWISVIGSCVGATCRRLSSRGG